MARPGGFEWTENKGGDVIITHNGRKAATLRGQRADDFLAEVSQGDAQELMARLTGNYKRGNERQAKNHARNKKGRR